MSAIESPCRNVCVLDAASGLCRGCGRTIDEIAAWSSYSPEQRRRVMDRLERGAADPAPPTRIAAN